MKKTVALTVVVLLVTSCWLMVSAKDKKPDEGYRDPQVSPHIRATVGLDYARELVKNGNRDEAVPLLHLVVQQTFKMDLSEFGAPNSKVLIQLDACRLAIQIGHRPTAENFLDAAQSSLRDIQTDKLRQERQQDIQFLTNKVKGMR